MSPTIDPGAAPTPAAGFLARVRPAIDADLARRLVFAAPAQNLHEAMRYAALGPGKRLRPALCVAACEAVGGTLTAALPAASAVELCHAYTLVHDDLPAMDDDRERRGRPTVHIAFGEATAILAGDGLLTAAFAALGDLEAGAADAVSVLAQRAGAGELLAGQAEDLAQAGSPQHDIAAIEAVAAAKTGALFAAAAELGAIAGGAGTDARKALAQYGMAIGIAFQHADDRDDRENIAHAEAAAGRIASLCQEAADIAHRFGDRAQSLGAIAAWIAGTA